MNLNPDFCLILKASDGKEIKENCYINELGSIGITADFVSVLSFDYCNVNELKENLLKPEEFSGLIFTSPRSVQAVINCISGSTINLVEKWGRHHIFTVGKVTATALESLHLPASGDASGNADHLAKHIIKCMPQTVLPLLFPCGNLRSEVLPTQLQQAGIAVKCMTVYCTNPHPDLRANIEDVMTKKGIPEYVIFFSPSGVMATVPILSDLAISTHLIKFIAIGPSTEAALMAANLKPFCTASKPSAKGVKEAILSTKSNG